jgi:hypothetical protein
LDVLGTGRRTARAAQLAFDAIRLWNIVIVMWDGFEGSEVGDRTN